MEAGGQLQKGLRPQLRAGPGREQPIPNPKLKLLDQVREIMRVKHYALRTERAYCDWIRHSVRFHRMRSRGERFRGTGKVEEFLSDLAVNGQVAASTQNQAFNVSTTPIYTQVLRQEGSGMKSPSPSHCKLLSNRT